MILTGLECVSLDIMEWTPVSIQLLLSTWLPKMPSLVIEILTNDINQQDALCMTKNEIKCIDTITTPNTSSCMRLYIVYIVFILVATAFSF